MSLPGFATRESTRAHAQRLSPEWSADAFRRLGRSELWVSKIGMGTFHCRPEDEGGRQALQEALRLGINVVDTSPMYADGGAELLIGEVLTHEAVWSQLPRDQIVVVSKVGYLQGETLERARERERQKRPFKDVLSLTSDLWYCIHPQFLEDQLTRSLARLHLDTLDVYLLHSPECFFLGTRGQSDRQKAGLRAEFYQRLRRAFVHLEKMVQEKLIRYYGLSSNAFTTHPEAFNFVSLGEVWRAYEQACAERRIPPEEGHLAVIEFPLNLIEHGAATAAVHAFEGKWYTLLELARKLDLGVLVHRPLNAVWRNVMIRLADFENPDLAVYQEQVRRLLINFREMESHLLQLLEKVYPRSRSQEKEALLAMFSLSSRLEALAQELSDPLSVIQRIQGTYLARIQEATRTIFGNVKPGEVNKIRDYLDAYLAHLKKLMPAIVKYTTSRNRDRLQPLMPVLKQFEGSAEGLSLAGKALLFSCSVPGVGTALNSMHAPQYVRDAQEVFSRYLQVTPEMLAELERIFPLDWERWV